MGKSSVSSQGPASDVACSCPSSRACWAARARAVGGRPSSSEASVTSFLKACVIQVNDAAVKHLSHNMSAANVSFLKMSVSAKEACALQAVHPIQTDYNMQDGSSKASCSAALPGGQVQYLCCVQHVVVEGG